MKFANSRRFKILTKVATIFVQIPKIKYKSPISMDVFRDIPTPMPISLWFIEKSHFLNILINENDF